MQKIKLLLLLLLINNIFFVHSVYSSEHIDTNSFIPEQYEGVYLEINKTKNILNVYLNGNIVYSYPVATGKTDAQTPEGSFKIITKVKEPWYLPKNIPGGDKRNPLGTRWLGLNVPNTGGYKYGIHGTSNPYSIGYHVSSGCIRMYNKDVEWLYRHIPLNTSVIIRSE